MQKFWKIFSHFLALVSLFTWVHPLYATTSGCDSRQLEKVFLSRNFSSVLLTPIYKKTEPNLPTPESSDITDVLLQVPTSPKAIQQLAQSLAITPELQNKIGEIESLLSQNAGHSLSLKEVSPTIVREKTNTSTGTSGPNCWNATLGWFFSNTPIQYTTPEAMESILNSRFRLLQFGEPPAYGDMIALRQSFHGQIYLLHTAIYLGNHLLWHKSGSSGSSPYVFSTLENMLHDYALNLSRGGFYHELYRIRD